MSVCGCTTKNASMAKRIKMQEFSFLCINFQRRKAEDVSPQRIRKFIAQMCLWIRLAKEAGADVVLIGITGPHWDGTQFLQLTEDKVLWESKHRLCHFGLKLDTSDEKPSNVCFRV